jgi:hypothetical protein
MMVMTSVPISVLYRSVFEGQPVCLGQGFGLLRVGLHEGIVLARSRWGMGEKGPTAAAQQ